VVWWLVGARLVVTATAVALGRDARSRQARLFSDLVAGVIYITAALIVLNSVLGLPVKGVLATSGVIAIVLGLALQNTLADVFSGIAVGIEQPFHVGDRITIGDNVEGLVVQMNWRSIRVQTDGEDVASIPNSIVAKSQIINRSVPTQRRAASIEVSTLSSVKSDILIDLVRQALLLCPNVLTEPTPSVLVKHVGLRSITIGVSYFVARTALLGAAKSDLYRQVRRFYHHAGVQAGAPLPAAELLGSLVLFESLNARQIAQLEKALVCHKYDPGQLLFAQGSLGKAVYIVRAGVFEIKHREADGHERVYGRIGPGEYLGEISMMTGEPRPVSVAALTTAEVFELPRAALEGLLTEDTGLSEALERSVKRGLALLDRDEAARTCHPLDDQGSLLGRIRTFLQRRLA
jgi:small-conductance mechanosensitive channel/CRP-like cAMP-binding protein